MLLKYFININMWKEVFIALIYLCITDSKFLLLQQNVSKTTMPTINHINPFKGQINVIAKVMKFMSGNGIWKWINLKIRIKRNSKWGSEVKKFINSKIDGNLFKINNRNLPCGFPYFMASFWPYYLHSILMKQKSVCCLVPKDYV